MTFLRERVGPLAELPLEPRGTETLSRLPERLSARPPRRREASEGLRPQGGRRKFPPEDHTRCCFVFSPRSYMKARQAVKPLCVDHPFVGRLHSHLRFGLDFPPVKRGGRQRANSYDAWRPHTVDLQRGAVCVFSFLFFSVENPSSCQLCEN